MNIRDLINVVNEASGDFDRYRKLGQNPGELITHLAKSATGKSSGHSDITSDKPKRVKDTSELKGVIDQVIAGKPLDSRSLQVLKSFRNTL